MIRQKMKASARILGFGLLAMAIGAPAALAQAKKAQCPFTSKDVDGWYKAIGFDTGADDAGRRGLVTCANEVSFATLDEVELRMGPKVIDGATVDALSSFKQILVDIQSTGGRDGGPKYSIELIRDGSPILDAKAGSDVSLSDAEYRACVAALTNSQAWNRWSCDKQ